MTIQLFSRQKLKQQQGDIQSSGHTLACEETMKAILWTGSSIPPAECSWASAERLSGKGLAGIAETVTDQSGSFV